MQYQELLPIIFFVTLKYFLTLKMRLVILVVFIVICNQTSASREVYNIEDYGAVGDGKTLNTKAIVAAIEGAYQNGIVANYVRPIIIDRWRKCLCSKGRFCNRSF